MQPEARALFNEHFSEKAYQQLLEEVNQEFPGQLDFRIAESPVFIPSDLKTKLLLAGNEIIDQLISEKLRQATEDAVPAGYQFPQPQGRPHFIALDFGICQNEQGEPEPKLIELQGFPSLFAFQHYLGAKYRKHFSIADGFSPYFNRLNGFGYQETIKKLLKPKAEENVVLLEAYPEKQKTRLDFTLSKLYFDLDVVCLSQVELDGSSLFYFKDGEKKQIDRVYNRVIFDELEHKYPELLPKLDVLKKADFQWVTHPAWYYKISKYCLPFLKGKAVPQTFFAHEAKEILDETGRFVLKPLFSFAGKGVNLNPTKEEIESLENASDYILQEKVTYEPCVLTTKGQKAKTEIRLLYIWPENSSRPRLITGLARLSRGEMIGVEHNKDLSWVGGSASFFETN